MAHTSEKERPKLATAPRAHDDEVMPAFGGLDEDRCGCRSVLQNLGHWQIVRNGVDDIVERHLVLVFDLPVELVVLDGDVVPGCEPVRRPRDDRDDGQPGIQCLRQVDGFLQSTLGVR